ncbi:MAG: hypothetical protein SPL75_00655 [Bacilli bacterium]|nr:hypothetical protein [Bacilli bacterium]MDY6362914.1 hypothetical protein [Bacilli bacterium]
MAKSKNLGFFSTYEAELTHKYYEKCQEENIRLMLMLMRECFIRNVTREDCEDMYNEFFAIAVKTYNPSITRFRYYLKKIVHYKTLDFVRRVQTRKDPLFYCVSLDIRNRRMEKISETLGEFDDEIKNFETILSSDELRKFALDPLDKIILIYRGSGWTLQQIADKLNMSVSGVRRRILAQRKNQKLLDSLHNLD